MKSTLHHRRASGGIPEPLNSHRVASGQGQTFLQKSAFKTGKALDTSKQSPNKQSSGMNGYKSKKGIVAQNQSPDKVGFIGKSLSKLSGEKKKLGSSSSFIEVPACKSPSTTPLPTEAISTTETVYKSRNHKSPMITGNPGHPVSPFSLNTVDHVP